MSRTLLILAKLVLLTLCVAYVLWEIDPQAMLEAIRGYSPGAVAAILLFSVFANFFPGYRIHYLSHHRIGAIRGGLASILCHGVNNLLPGKLGELAKALYLSLGGRMKRAEALGIVFWERFLDINALLVFALIALVLSGQDLALLPFGLATLGFWGALFALRHWPALYHRVLAILPSERLRGFLLELREQIIRRMEARFLLGGGLHTLAVWLVYGTQTLLVLLWAAHLELTPSEALVVFVAAGLGASVPSTPGGLGVFEAAVVVTLGWFGIDKEEALTAALVLHFSEYIPTVLLTLPILFRSRIHLSGLTHQGPETGDAPPP